MSRSRRHLGRRGFSLVEIIAAIFVATLGITAVAYMYGAAMTVSSDAAMSEKAFFLANSLLNEISERRFYESSTYPGNGPETGEVSGFDRQNFDDIDDYNVFKATWIAVNPPRDRTGTTIPDSSQFSQWVEVINVPAPTAGAARTLSSVTAGSTNFKKVTVKITWDSGRRQKSITKVFALP